MFGHKTLGEVIMNRFGDQEEKVLPDWNKPVRETINGVLQITAQPAKVATALMAVAAGIALTAVLERMDDARGQEMIVKRDLPAEISVDSTMLASR